MIESLPIAGLFILACTFQDVDPMLGSPIGDPHPASLVSRDGTGAMIAWTEIDGQGRVAVRRNTEGTVILSGLHFHSSGEETWAVLKPQGKQAYAAEWLGYDQIAKDGRRTVFVWSRGTCEELGTNSPTQSSAR